MDEFWKNLDIGLGIFFGFAGFALFIWVSSKIDK